MKRWVWITPHGTAIGEVWAAEAYPVPIGWYVPDGPNAYSLYPDDGAWVHETQEEACAYAKKIVKARLSENRREAKRLNERLAGLKEGRG